MDYENKTNEELEVVEENQANEEVTETSAETNVQKAAAGVAFAAGAAVMFIAVKVVVPVIKRAWKKHQERKASKKAVIDAQFEENSEG